MHWALIENHEQELTKGKRPTWITMVNQGQKKVERAWVELGQRKSSNKWSKTIKKSSWVELYQMKRKQLQSLNPQKSWKR
jgi:hypothetical protein